MKLWTQVICDFICVHTLPLLAFPPVPPRNVCRALLTSPSWPCSSCTCWRLFLATSPSTVTPCEPRVLIRWMEDFFFLINEALCCRRGGVRAAAHLQSGGPPGRPRALRASGCAGGRHPHRPCGSFPSKDFACSTKEKCRLNSDEF